MTPEPLPDLVKRLTGLKAEADHWRAEWGDQADPAYEQQYSQALAEAAPRLLAAAESLVRMQKLLTEARTAVEITNGEMSHEGRTRDGKRYSDGRCNAPADCARCAGEDLLARIDAEMGK